MSQVTDPVCGMTIETATAAGGRAEHELQRFYFCSDSCRRAFKEEPERFVPERHEAPYTVKGGVTAPKFGSAGSGGLEHDPLPERHDDRPERR